MKNPNIGDKFHRWIVLSGVFYKTFPSGSKAKFVKVICSCGSLEKEVRLAALTSPSAPSKSCGCIQKEYASQITTIIEIGKIYGRLKIMKSLVPERDIAGNIRHQVECLCECGNICISRYDALVEGKTNSCGCYHKDVLKALFTTHGMSNTPLYYRWQGMKDRCYNPNATGYENYGGRGIKVDSDWLEFEGFYRDMSEDFSEEKDIDRIDFNSDYSKENCRWVLRDIGNHNKSKDSNYTSEYKGVYWDKTKELFVARLYRNGEKLLSKYFKDEYKAALAYDNKSEEVYGDRPNKTSKENLNEPHNV